LQLARDKKVEVAAINVRIPEDMKRDYVALLADVAETKKAFAYVAIRLLRSSLSTRKTAGV